MKIAVSYISSELKFKDTINKINESAADYIHVDIMDGKYVEVNNLKQFKIKTLLKQAKKPLDIHFMTMNPSKYFKKFVLNEYTENIYFHPSSEKRVLDFIDDIKKHKLTPGIVVDLEEDLEEFYYLLPHVKRVLIMSVKAGYGGQDFSISAVSKIKSLIQYRETENLDFKISVDGGINSSNIKLIKELDIDIVVSGSFITNNDDYDKQINKLK